MKLRALTVLIALVVVVTGVFFVIKSGGEVAAQTDNAQFEETIVRIAYKGKRWAYTRRDYDIDSDIFTVKNEIKERIRATHSERVELMNSVKEMGFTDRQAVEYAFFGIDKVVAAAKSSIDLVPKDAEISFFPNRAKKFVIRRDAVGFRVDDDALYTKLFNELQRSATVEVRLVPKILRAEKTYEKLSQATTLRSVFETSYAESSPDRKHNVWLALSKFNGMRVDAGEVVSFNAVVGARSVRNGFKEAKIIKNGRYEDGVGGGVCQSSTTLYNATLLAGLNIKKVSQHSLSCSYVEPSFDAMVNSSSADLVFENTGELPVFIRTYHDENVVGVEIYGTKLPYEIKRKSIVTSIIPHGGDNIVVDTAGKYLDKVQYKGERARINYPKDGMTSEGYLEYYVNGKLVQSKRIRKNKYIPQQGLVVEGTKEKPIELEDSIDKINPPNTESPIGEILQRIG